MNTIKSLIASRKFVAACIAAAVVIAGRLGFELDAATLAIVATPFTIAIGGWSFEDAAQKGAPIAAYDGTQLPAVEDES